MTTTVQDIVRGALMLLGVLDVGEAIPAQEANDGLTILNDMIQSWASRGVHTGVGELVLTDESPFEDLHTKGVKNLLAVELAGPYGKSIPDKVASDAVMAWQMILADFKPIDLLIMDDGLRNMPSERRIVSTSTT